MDKALDFSWQIPQNYHSKIFKNFHAKVFKIVMQKIKKKSYEFHLKILQRISRINSATIFVVIFQKTFKRNTLKCLRDILEYLWKILNENYLEFFMGNSPENHVVSCKIHQNVKFN